MLDKKDEPCQKDFIAMNAAALAERHITLKETNIRNKMSLNCRKWFKYEVEYYFVKKTHIDEHCGVVFHFNLKIFLGFYDGYNLDKC